MSSHLFLPGWGRRRQVVCKEHVHCLAIHRDYADEYTRRLLAEGGHHPALRILDNHVATFDRKPKSLRYASDTLGAHLSADLGSRLLKVSQ